ncbi:MAG: GDP-mannose 4,6-dehydratase [Sterolibacterium sp.]|nr:GDP-mannose 4,6-dehydratase [Sterolibacterium sp.]
MKRLFITGVTGFVGKTFQCMSAEIAREHGWTLLPPDITPRYNLLDPASLSRALQDARPDGVIHLAGQSFVPDAIKNPTHTLQVNLMGTLNLLQALKETGFNGSLLYVSSGDVYGQVRPEMLPITETQAADPQNPYAVSKAAAEMLCRQWSLDAPWRIVVARPFNHIGPGQRPEFVVSGIARQIARIRLGRCDPIIEVGDIDVTRDFLDVRDLARAYLSLLIQGQNGTTYNVCSGREHSIREIIGHLTRLGEITPEIRHDATRYRPADQRRVCGDNTRLRAATGWQPTLSLEQSLHDALLDWQQIECTPGTPDIPGTLSSRSTAQPSQNACGIPTHSRCADLSRTPP